MAIGLLTKTDVGKSGRSKSRRPREPADLFEMANLFPEDTGLPVTVWVSPRGNARRAARIKVCRVGGNRMGPSNAAVVAIVPEPRLIEGKLPGRYLEPVTQWVALNAEALLRYWNGEIGTGGLLRELRRVAPADASPAPRETK
jgi:hypothetical protein